MKNLLLSVLALIVLAGTMFAPSESWSFTPDNEVCFLSDSPIVAINTAVIQVDPTEEKTVLQNHNIFNKILSGNTLIPSVLIVREVLGAASWSSISCLDCNTINPYNVITANGPGQKRVAVYLC